MAASRPNSGWSSVGPASARAVVPKPHSMFSHPSPTAEALLTAALPKNWPSMTKAAVVHTAALARTVFTLVVGDAGGHESECPRCAQLEVEVAVLREECELLRSRFGRMSPEKRPHFTRVERLRALKLVAARGWNRVQAGAALLVTPATISRWLGWADADSPNLEHEPPINKYPDVVTAVLHDLKAMFPHFGKRRLAQMLARVGLHLAETTIARRLREPTPKPSAPVTGATAAASSTDIARADTITKTVVARYPNHVWGCDISVVPTFLGFWVPWFPFSIAPSWPFCFHVVAVIDFFSRKAMGTAAFKQNPSAADIALVLDHAVARAGQAPRHFVSDKGSQFWSAVTKKASTVFQVWCDRHGVRPRFGAVGKTGSIALVERFWRSLKSECTRRVMIPFGIDAMNVALSSYAAWHNTWRPHQGLGGATPMERYRGLTPARDEARVEVREQYPLRDARAVARGSPEGTRAKLRGLRVTSLDGRQELPRVELVYDQAA